MHTSRLERIANVPIQFRQPDQFLYPEDNNPDFESWFFENTQSDEIPSDFNYLPIFFTAYFKRNRFGADQRAIKLLQDFVDSLDSSKRYFTICQFDDGTLIDWKRLDIKIFAMSGKPLQSFAIPLVCQPHRFAFPNAKKDIFCSFVGKDTHPIRKILLRELAGKKGFFVTDRDHSLQDYCNVLARSIFVLCPRGYGLNSFRIAESLQYGAIPIIITDEEAPSVCFNPCHPILYGLSKKADELELILRRFLPSEVLNFQSVLPQVYQQYYTFEGTKDYILKNLI